MTRMKKTTRQPSGATPTPETIAELCDILQETTIDKITTDAVGAGPSSDVTEEFTIQRAGLGRGRSENELLTRPASALTAQERASRLANRLGGSHSAPASRVATR